MAITIVVVVVIATSTAIFSSSSSSKAVAAAADQHQRQSFISFQDEHCSRAGCNIAKVPNVAAESAYETISKQPQAHLLVVTILT